MRYQLKTVRNCQGQARAVFVLEGQVDRALLEHLCPGGRVQVLPLAGKVPGALDFCRVESPEGWRLAAGLGGRELELLHPPDDPSPRERVERLLRDWGGA